jgi:hypothetical protein
MGLLCGESTLRRCLGQVHRLAHDTGFYSMPEGEDGNIRCWGDHAGPFKEAINRYVKAIYFDACCDSVTSNAPFLLPVTGDGVRASQRGTYVTVAVGDYVSRK